MGCLHSFVHIHADAVFIRVLSLHNALRDHLNLSELSAQNALQDAARRRFPIHLMACQAVHQKVIH